MKHYCHKSFFLLSLMKRLKPNEREQILHHLSDKAVDILSECVYNIVKGNKLNEKQYKRLKKKLYARKHNLRLISNNNITASRRRKALSQEGGALGTILATAIPIITSLISGLSK